MVKTEPSWLPRTLVERLGAALVAPICALKAADDPDAPGRAASDAALVLAVAMVASFTADLIGAVWVGVADGVGVGASALVGLVGRGVGPHLVLILALGTAVTAAAGRRRAIGRDFDLACVAYVPFVLVELGARLATGLGVLHPEPPASDVIGVLAYGWAIAVGVLAIREARRRA